MGNKNFKDFGYLLTDKQFEAEIERCEYCEDKPCRDGCPVNCSPADFIKAVEVMEDQDFKRAAGIVMKNNPLGGVCGMVCPDKHCMAECSHKLFDEPLDIPTLQAEIVKRAKELGGIPEFTSSSQAAQGDGKKVAVVGAGPAGLGAAGVLAQKGYKVEIFEVRNVAGGMCNLIPDHRLDKDVLKTDIEFLKTLGDIDINLNSKVENFKELQDKGYEAVVVSTGLWKPIMPGAKNEDKAVTSVDYLSSPGDFDLNGNVGIIGGGATALDCAVTAKKNGAGKVELFALENLSELPLTDRERDELVEYDIEVTGRTRVRAINFDDEAKVKSIDTNKLALEGGEFSLDKLKDIPETNQKRKDIDHLIIAVGNLPEAKKIDQKGVFYAGDFVNGPTTVVEAVAAGKNSAEEVNSFFNNKSAPRVEDRTRSNVKLPGYVDIPVSLETDFFGTKIPDPFLLSAAPPTDGYDQMKEAYEVGWTGGVMKTTFAEGPIHIPGEYMYSFSENTYGNCDNVSGHLIDRVSGEIEKLVKEFPDKLTIASTGGPVTGNDTEDMKGWQSNTKTLENAGAKAIEYSLSCPQGGEGTEGDIVSQSAELTAKVIDWVMQVSNPDVPKLFKLSAAVTSIETIMNAVKKVLDKYPEKKAGVTLANTFPVLGFQDRDKKEWENGVVLGMSGEGVAPISYHTLARAVPIGVTISGNGGPMDYRQTANFLALGAKTVQYCTIVMKEGYGIIDDLRNGVSYLMKERGISSMDELIGIAQPDAITDFMDLSDEKKISSLIDEDLCMQCGNCTRCPYLAISMNEDNYPETDASKCIGCSICVQKCFSGALEMRERTAEEKEKLSE